MRPQPFKLTEHMLEPVLLKKSVSEKAINPFLVYCSDRKLLGVEWRAGHICVYLRDGRECGCPFKQFGNDVEKAGFRFSCKRGE